MTQFFKHIGMVIAMTISASGAAKSLNHASELPLEAQLGQKLMLDFRYYCESGESKACRQGMTELPKPLAELIAKHHIGGVILFAENVPDTAQIVKLTNDLQTAAQQAKHPQPLFISIDQEGGRVARINRAEATSFTGNMSIGATYHKHGTHYASAVATAIGKELNSLGINVNFAPTVDVNNNAGNPVINVRSFSENSLEVAKMGAAQVEAFEAQNVISALKHFPGHGDTSVDSHTGLPLVKHDLKRIEQVELAPFKYIIDKHAPGMIMTAHIQYPALDNSTFVNKQGEAMIKPATLSRKIMHDLLREKLNYQGVTVTDALDMAGISHFFSPTSAVIETFKAGVDIALMPIAIRTPEDIQKLDELMSALNAAVTLSELNETEIAQSAQRIISLKQKFLANQAARSSAIAKATLGNPSHRQLESELAVTAITQVKNQGLLPIQAKHKRIHLVMPDTQKCHALEQALLSLSKQKLHITCSSLQGFDPKQADQNITNSDLIIAAHASPQQSAVEIGGMDDVKALDSFKLKRNEQPKALLALLKQAKLAGKPTLFISLRAPYEIPTYAPYAQAVLASYAYNVDVVSKNVISGPAFTALAKVILGLEKPEGQLPVSI